MKNFLRTAIAAAVLAAPIAGAMSTTATAGGHNYNVHRGAHVKNVAYYDVLNIRRYPAYYSAKVGGAKNGAKVYVKRCKVRPHGSKSDWCLIKHYGTHGWVNKRFLAIH